MCDCYTAKCEGCKSKIEVHIGDFSQSQGNVHVFCENCEEDMLNYVTEKPELHRGPWLLFVDKTTNVSQGPSGIVYFLVELPHGIHLN